MSNRKKFLEHYNFHPAQTWTSPFLPMTTAVMWGILVGASAWIITYVVNMKLLPAQKYVGASLLRKLVKLIGYNVGVLILILAKWNLANIFGFRKGSTEYGAYSFIIFSMVVVSTAWHALWPMLKYGIGQDKGHNFEENNNQ